MTTVALGLLLALQSHPSPQAAADAILGALLGAEENAQSVSYVVKREYTDDAVKTHKGHSTVLLQKTPFRARAEHYGEDGSLLDLTVSDDKRTHGSDATGSDEAPTLAPDGSGAMIVLNDSGTDVAMTWNLLVHPDFLREAMASGKAEVIWQEEIENDECNVLFYPHDERADFYWFSIKTGLPRAVLRMSTLSGRARMAPLSVIDDIRFNPVLPSEAFTFKPTPVRPAQPGSKATATATAAPQPALVGRQLPALEVRDPAYNAFTLDKLTGKPTLVTLWAPWCGPCVGELAALTKLRPRFGDRFEVIAIGVQDKRRNILKFIGAHGDYSFRFFTDPDLEDSTSRLGIFFGAEAPSGAFAIPVSVFADAHGQIVSQWGGFENEEDLGAKLMKLLESYPDRDN